MFNDFIDNLNKADIGAILVIIYVIARVVLGIFELIATKNTSTLKKSIKELETMVYRKPDYKEAKNFDPKAQKQTFTNFVPEYKYNDKTGELVATGGKIDIDALIQSHVDTCLNAVLDKFLPGFNEPVVPDEAFGEEVHQDLADYAEMIEQGEVLRDKYSLGDDLSTLEIYQAVAGLADKQKAYNEGLVKATENAEKQAQIDALKKQLEELEK